MQQVFRQASADQQVAIAELRVRSADLRLGVAVTPTGILAAGALVTGILLATALVIRESVQARRS